MSCFGLPGECSSSESHTCCDNGQCVNTGRYIASDGRMLCGVCTVKLKIDAIRISDVPALLSWARKFLAANTDDRPRTYLRDLRSLLGKDISSADQ